MITYGLSRISWDDAQLDNMLHGPTGAVGRYMRRKAREHTAASKAMVGKDSGKLARTIDWEQKRGKRFQKITITADTKYAYYQHEKTRPHTIKARGRGVLVFRVRGKSVRTKSVQHPGSKANPFLTAPLRPVWGR